MTRLFCKKLFGYNPKQVDEWIDHFRLEKQSRIDQLNIAIAKLKTENELLHDKISELRSTSGSISYTVLEKAREQADRSGKALIESSRRKKQSIIDEGQSKAAIYRSNVLATEKRIDFLRKEFLSMLDSLFGILNAQVTQYEAAASLEKIAGTILQSKDKERLFISETREGLLRINMDFQSKNIFSKNGTKIGQVKNIILDKNNGILIGYEIGTSTTPEVPTGSLIPTSEIIALKKEGLVVGDNYIDNLIIPEIYTEKHFEKLKSESTNAEEKVTETKEFYSFSEDDSELNERRKTNEENIPTAHSPFASEIPDPGLDLAVKKHRMGYVVGKLVGLDLKDPDEKLIAKKGEVITPEIVARADAAGKLAELIINMQIPGIELDEAL